MSDFIAARMDDIPFSSIRAVFEQVDTLRAEGRKIIPFHIGTPDFDTPQHIKDAAKKALDDGLVGYTSNYGLPALRQAIARKLASDNGISADPDGQIIVTVGANEAVLLAMLATLNPGDEVLIPDPMWLHYFYCARLAGARVVSVPLRQENNFELDPDDVRSRITPRTRMLVINSPHNPTGAVFTRGTLLALAEIVSQHGLLLLSDEIYEKIRYDGVEHVSPAAFPGLQDQVLTVNGFSKSYAMTGWRLGYVTSSRALVDAMVRVHQYTTVCAASFAQAGAVAALNGSQAALHDMVTEFDARRRVIIQAFTAMPGLQLVAPQGAFYAFPNVSSLGADSAFVARDLLRRAGLAVVPGSAFGDYGEGFVRISYACSLQDVRAGMEILQSHLLRAP